jgi:VanZ family protein
MLRNSKKGYRIGAWLCVLLLAYLSLVPEEFQSRTGAPGQLEHFFAYSGTAIIFMFSYPQTGIPIAVGLSAYGGFLEVLQSVSPGRSPSVIDAVASMAGTCFGVIVCALITRCLRY